MWPHINPVLFCEYRVQCRMRLCMPCSSSKGEKLLKWLTFYIKNCTEGQIAIETLCYDLWHDLICWNIQYESDDFSVIWWSLLLYGAKWIILTFSYFSPEFIYRYCATPVWLLSRPGCCAIRCCSRVSPSAQIPEDWEGSHSEAGKLPSKSTACLVLIVLLLPFPSRPLYVCLATGRVGIHTCERNTQ